MIEMATIIVLPFSCLFCPLGDPLEIVHFAVHLARPATSLAWVAGLFPGICNLRL